MANKKRGGGRVKVIDWNGYLWVALGALLLVLLLAFLLSP